jgi:hypothetical protein
MINDFTFDYGQLYNPNLIGLPITDGSFTDENNNLPLWKNNRRASLGQSVEVVDPFNRKIGSFSSYREPFMASAKEFIATARRAPTRNRGGTVSDFSSWIYSLYVKRKLESQLIQGKIDEKAVLSKKIDISSKNFALTHPFEWTLVHNGITEDIAQKPYEISSLIVDGRPLRASPDLLFRNGLHTAIIVEIKSTLHDIPSNLWPNVWAQLWAYSKIDFIRDFNKVVVVGEIWGRYGDVMYLRKSVKNDPRRKNFDDFFQELFNIYSN